VTNYDVIVVDPPWSYGSDTKRPNRTAEAHYKTIGHNGKEINRRTGKGVEGIAEAAPIGNWAKPDSHLYVWVTNPKLPFVWPLLAAWGFEYKTLLTWEKVTKDGQVHGGGMGWFFRGATEHVVFAVKGRKAIPSGLRRPNLFRAPLRGHSVKPDEFYDLLDAIYVGGERRLDVFARRGRLGWDTWGDQAPGTNPAQTVKSENPPGKSETDAAKSDACHPHRGDRAARGTP